MTNIQCWCANSGLGLLTAKQEVMLDQGRLWVAV